GGGGKGELEERCRPSVAPSWRTGAASLGDLLDRARPMPPSRPGSLDDESYVDLVAFSAPGKWLPSGEQPDRADLAANVAMPLSDEQPVNRSIVRILGCLGARRWRLVD